MIATLLMFGGRMTPDRLVRALAWGALAGGVLQFLVQVPRVLRLNREINDVFQLGDIRTLLASSQIEVGGGTPEAFGALIKRETERWGPVIRATGAKLD